MLFAISEAFSSIRDFMEAGGSVLWLIALLVFFMWGMIFERIWYLSHAHNDYVSRLASKWNARSDKESWHALQIREKMMSQAKMEINKNISIIQTCIVLAPLLGLLGTVTGMIEVFHLLAVTGGGDAKAAQKSARERRRPLQRDSRPDDGRHGHCRALPSRAPRDPGAVHVAVRSR